jgi:prepilin-type N-terminal cleavage/methylation domain-containing protein
MSKYAMNLPQKNLNASGTAGFSLVELLLVITIIGVVASYAFLTFEKSTKGFKLAGATRTLSGYLEKARVDSVRRHGGASINITSATSYTVNIDFGGVGVTSARTITLPQGTSIRYSLPPANTSINPATTPITVTYDWRGRTGTTVLITVTDATAGVGSSTVVVGPAGDVSTDTTVSGPVTVPTPQTSVSTTSGIKTMQ